MFHVSDSLGSFIISLKDVLVLLRYSPTDSILLFYFYQLYFCIQYDYYSKNYLLLLVSNKFLLLFHTQNNFLTFLILYLKFILLIFLVYEDLFYISFSLKRFVISSVIFSASDLGMFIIKPYEED